jgi:S1-C subfamily serine protease
MMASNEVNVFEALSTQLAAAVEKVAPAVATVHGRRRFPSAGIYWRKGALVTASHTLKREEGITVTLSGGRDVSATLAGRDPSTDLAVLKIADAEVALPEITQPVSLKVGQLALAVGRVDGVPRASLAAIGLVAGPWRTWYGGEVDRLIRLDRELHPTLSGGPLVDAHGGVVGINTSGLSRILGVTIPAETVNRVADVLLEKGYVGRGYLGLGLYAVPIPSKLQEARSAPNLSGRNGLIVLSVESDGPAGKAGVIVGDLITALDGQAVGDTDDLQKLLTHDRIGQAVTTSILRGGSPLELRITVGQRPHLHS